MKTSFITVEWIGVGYRIQDYVHGTWYEVDYDGRGQQSCKCNREGCLLPSPIIISLHYGTSLLYFDSTLYPRPSAAQPRTQFIFSGPGGSCKKCLDFARQPPPAAGGDLRLARVSGWDKFSDSYFPLGDLAIRQRQHST